MKRRSVKKTMAVIGGLDAYAMSTYAVYKDPSLIGVVLMALVPLIVALFAIKKYFPGSKNDG